MTVVALVEDDPAIRSVLARALTQRGHQVFRTAATGLGALSQIVEHTPELAVLGLGLPDIGGADKTVDVHLSWLRGKLGETASEPQYLRSVRGVDIMLVDPTQ